MKTDDKNEQEPSKKRKYKKRYLLRMLEQQEAQQEIKRYEDEESLGTSYESTNFKSTDRTTNSLG